MYENDLCENNGRYNIYLNTNGSKGNIDFDLKELFKYIRGKESAIGMETKSKLVKTIDKYVQEFNSNDTWRRGAMTVEMLMQENCELAREEGEAKGRAEAEAKAKEKEAQTVKNFYAKNIPLETIAECTALSLEDVNKILSAK